VRKKAIHPKSRSICRPGDVENQPTGELDRHLTKGAHFVRGGPESLREEKAGIFSRTKTVMNRHEAGLSIPLAKLHGEREEKRTSKAMSRDGNR